MIRREESDEEILGLQNRSRRIIEVQGITYGVEEDGDRFILKNAKTGNIQRMSSS